MRNCFVATIGKGRKENLEKRKNAPKRLDELNVLFYSRSIRKESLTKRLKFAMVKLH